MRETRDLFKNIRDTKGTFHAKMGSIKDRNGMDLTEHKISRRGGKNTQTVRPHRRQPTRLPRPGILQARTMEWVAIGQD